MQPNLQFPADLITFTEEILDGKLHFLCSAITESNYRSLTFAGHKINVIGIIQTLRNAVFGENLALPPPLVTVRNVSNISLPSVTQRNL